MDVANPSVIRDFMICRDRRLPNAAKHRGVKPAVASVIREHWMRRITGRCVRCGYHVKGDKCPKCSTSAPPPISFLENLSPDTELLRVECQRCQEPMFFTAGDVLKVVQRRGSFNPNRMCERCRREKYLKARDARQKRVSRWENHRNPSTPIKKSKVEVAPKPQKPAPATTAFCRRDGTLRHMPFLALRGLKIEK